MNELKSIQEDIVKEGAPVRVGTVAQVLDDERIVVQTGAGAYRRVFGAAKKGERVTIQGDTLLGRVAPGVERTVYVA